MEPQEIIDAVDNILNLPENGGGVREIINGLYALKSRAETATDLYRETREWLKISEAECEELTAENERLYREWKVMADMYDNLLNSVGKIHELISSGIDENRFLENWRIEATEKINRLEGEKINLHRRIEELEAVLTRIDAIAPAADDTCLEPGITLSEAVRRELRDDSIDTCDQCDRPAYQYWIDGTRYCREHQINRDSSEMERGQ